VSIATSERRKASASAEERRSGSTVDALAVIYQEIANLEI
jgi:hypothetical protein